MAAFERTVRAGHGLEVLVRPRRQLLLHPGPFPLPLLPHPVSPVRSGRSQRHQDQRQHHRRGGNARRHASPRRSPRRRRRRLPDLEVAHHPVVGLVHQRLHGEVDEVAVPARAVEHRAPAGAVARARHLAPLRRRVRLHRQLLLVRHRHPRPPHHVEVRLPKPVAAEVAGLLDGVARRGAGGARAVTVEALALGVPGDAQAVRAARRRQLAPLRDRLVVRRPRLGVAGPVVRAEVAVVVYRHPPEHAGEVEDERVERQHVHRRVAAAALEVEAEEPEAVEAAVDRRRRGVLRLRLERRVLPVRGRRRRRPAAVELHVQRHVRLPEPQREAAVTGDERRRRGREVLVHDQRVGRVVEALPRRHRPRVPLHDEVGGVEQRHDVARGVERPPQHGAVVGREDKAGVEGERGRARPVPEVGRRGAPDGEGRREVHHGEVQRRLADAEEAQGEDGAGRVQQWLERRRGPGRVRRGEAVNELRRELFFSLGPVHREHRRRSHAEEDEKDDDGSGDRRITLGSPHCGEREDG